MKKAAIAQLAERQTEDLKVAGSTPARGNQYNFFSFYLFLFIFHIVFKCFEIIKI